MAGSPGVTAGREGGSLDQPIPVVRSRGISVKPLFLLAILALSGCAQPMLSADMAIDGGGLTVSPTLSGVVGNTAISLQPN